LLPVDIKKSSYYLREQLTKTLPRIYDVNYTQLWGLNNAINYHQSIGDLPLGLEFLDVWMKENLGQIPAIYDGNSDDIPVVDVEIGKKSYKAAMFALANEWNILQIEKQRLADQLNTLIPSLNLITTKQDAVADYFNRGEHYTILYGYPKVGIRGIFSQAGIAQNDATFQPYKKAAGAYTVTTAQLLEDLIDIIMQFVQRAKLTSPSQVQMKIPPRLARRLIEMYKTTAGESIGMTIQQMLKSSELGLGIGAIDVHNELQGSELNKYVPNESATGFYPTNRDRIVFKATTYQAERHFYARRPFTPYQRSTLQYEQVTIGATTGIINIYPEYYWYYDFDNSLV
jgi:hypothetical protein